jgi:hypothetical protein
MRKYNFHYLQDIFNHPNRKYNLKILLQLIITLSINILLIDTTLISNKLGIDNIGYNPQHPKHKVSKVSLTVSTIHVHISYHRRKWYSVDG